GQRPEIRAPHRGVRFLAHRHADGAAALEHDPEKWEPVFGKDHAQTKKFMTFSVAVQDTAIRFPCEPNESVLDAAQRAGYEIPYSCRKGVCGTCKGRVVAGEVRAYSGDALGAAERDAGEVLFCNARPRSDLTIAPRAISKTDPFARKTLTAKVFRIARLTDDVVHVHWRFPP